jgi:hypothetical protein
MVRPLVLPVPKPQVRPDLISQEPKPDWQGAVWCWRSALTQYASVVWVWLVKWSKYRYMVSKRKLWVLTPHQPVEEQHRFIPQLTLPSLLSLPHIAVALQVLPVHYSRFPIISITQQTTLSIRRSAGTHISSTTVVPTIPTSAMDIAATNISMY